MGSDRTSKQRFCGIPYSMVISSAWRSLKCSSIKIYVELLNRYNGQNNGDLHLSYASASNLLYVGKSTVSRAFAELQEKGFIVQTKEGSWDDRRAATWRMTHLKDDRPNGGLSTNDWLRWSNANPGLNV